MIDSPRVGLQLQRRCPNRNGHQVREHVQLEGVRARAAQVHPPECCRAVCRGLVKQMEVEGNGQHLLTHMEHDDDQSSKDSMGTAKQAH